MIWQFLKAKQEYHEDMGSVRSAKTNIHVLDF